MKFFNSILALGMIGLASAKSLRQLDDATYSSDGFQQLMLDAVNAYRATQGLGSLCLNKKLLSAAQAHSNDMAANDYMEHNSPVDGSTMKSRIVSTGFVYTGIAENVAAGQDTVDSVMDSWIASPGHQANLVGDYKYFGIGYAYNVDTTYCHYWTQDFAQSDDEDCDSDYSSDASTPEPTTAETEAPSSDYIGTVAPSTPEPTTAETEAPTTAAPTTATPTTAAPTTAAPTTEAPTTEAPTTAAPTTEAPTPAPTETGDETAKDCETNFGKNSDY